MSFELFKTHSGIIIPRPKKLKETVQRFIKEGTEKIHVISDFDRTLTYAFNQGKKIPSLISLLRSGGYLSRNYTQKAQQLFNKYHPIEINPQIPLKKKKQAMARWWKEHYQLLIKSGLTQIHIKQAVKEANIKLRNGVLKFFQKLASYQIPLIIFSSTGLGRMAIELVLTRYKIHYSNIFIISNDFVWDDKGRAIEVKKPVIHVFNKDETSIQLFPHIFKEIRDRKNVLLLGDSLGDVGMVNGFNWSNLIRIGFLNEEIGQQLPKYKTNFDLIILRDGDFVPINELLKKILDS